MDETILRQARDLMKKSLEAETDWEAAKILGLISDFISKHDQDHMAAFVVESSQGAMSVFRNASSMNLGSMNQWPRQATRFVTGIAAIFITEFHAYPREASVMFYMMCDMAARIKDEAANKWLDFFAMK